MTGNAGDSPALPVLLDQLRIPRCGPGRPRTTPDALRGDKGSRGGRPVGFDAEDYKNRNVVERAFRKLKNWRGLATRYDKHALINRGGMVLASIVLWLTA
jgi:putative transposase